MLMLLLSLARKQACFIQICILKTHTNFLSAMFLGSKNNQTSWLEENTAKLYFSSSIFDKLTPNTFLHRAILRYGLHSFSDPLIQNVQWFLGIWWPTNSRWWHNDQNFPKTKQNKIKRTPISFLQASSKDSGECGRQWCKCNRRTRFAKRLLRCWRNYSC